MKVLCVFAHPDDESFSCGGTIAKLTKKGATVKLITATRGEAGSVGDTALCTQEELGNVREKELRSAAKILGISQIFFLDYKDGKLDKISVAELSEKIEKIIVKEQPDIVITFNKEGGSRHPDHMQINKAATHAFASYVKKTDEHVRLYYADIPKSLLAKLEQLGTLYTSFGKIEGTHENDITTVVNILKTTETKLQAFKCHKTQEKDWKNYIKRKNLPEFTKEFFTLAQENELA
ncbi:MAG: PIG-L family deacetylase [Candidatus Levyibacteriota bacterium]|nr:MAG: PIG-L family deacetylase [Candidatus Levybacteria bacterium]